MTDRDKIIAAAKKAGLHIGSDDDPHTALWWYPEVERFYAIAFEAGRQAERESINLDDGTIDWRGENEV